jgi:predicted nucleic acid-binding protein
MKTLPAITEADRIAGIIKKYSRRKNGKTRITTDCIIAEIEAIYPGTIE